MKLFIALFPSKEVLDNLRDTRRKYVKYKRHFTYIPIDQLHVTLKYLGNKVSEFSYEQIALELKKHEGNYGPVQITVKGIQFGFPKQSNPRVLMAKVIGSEETSQLAEVVHNLVRNLRFRDVINFRRRYGKNYHITLARSTDRTSRNVVKSIISDSENLKTVDLGTFTATEMAIVASEFSFTKGVTYKVLDIIKL